MTATHAPRRALIVSADIGEGHNSAGRAVKEAIGRAWRGCEVAWLDALAAIEPLAAESVSLAGMMAGTITLATGRAAGFETGQREK